MSAAPSPRSSRPASSNCPRGSAAAALETVFITVTIEAQQGWRALQVAPVFEDLPEGLEVAAGIYAVDVRLAGPEPELASLAFEDVTATISFADALPGRARYEVEVSAPEGIEVVAVAPLWVALVPSTPVQPEGGEAGVAGDGEQDEQAETDEDAQ